MALTASAQAKAEGAGGPWVDDGVILPEWATAVRIVRTDESILSEPTTQGVRRGSAAREARLPLFGAAKGQGCRAPWYSVGPNAWVCGEHVELTRGEPVPASAPTFPASSDGLPYRYYFVGPEGADAYRRLREVDIGQADQYLQPGFAVGIAEQRTFEGQSYGRSANDLWIPMRNLGPARPTAFEGSEVPKGSTDIPFAWVIATSARVYAKPNAAALTRETLARFVRVDVLDSPSSRDAFLRIGDSRWVRRADVGHPTIAPPPPEVDIARAERWIDVDLSTQTLVAFEGAEPVFATLVSTGKGRQGSASATPKGTHRIWVKLGAANMDNLEDENARRNYRMESVPFVQYFSKGVGLHGAYWHQGFGRVRSHGCVNLAPRDAERLFWFTEPRLPAGWTAVLPSAFDRGNVVRVR